jgi:hypothetical protein
MRLTIRLDPNRSRQWHLRLVQRLAQRPLTRVAVEWGGGAASLPRAATVMAAIECLLYRLPGRNPFAVATAADFALFVSRDVGGQEVGGQDVGGQDVGGQHDVVFDLCGGDLRPGERTWHLYFDGRREEAAAIGALIRSRTPVVSIVDATTGGEIVSGHPGVQNSRVLARAFDDVMARTATLVKAALDGATPRFRGERPVHARAGTAAIAWFWLKSMSVQALTLFYRLFYNTPHWRIGYRFVRGRDVVDLRAHPVGGWSVLPDNGLRFYSDPFPVEKDGRTFLFLEDLEHRLNRGVISVVEFDSGGPIGTPRPVLDTGSHLSYPFVFEHGGEMWMVPESCSTASVDLYRAERFPDGWVKQATLVSGVVASDATLFQHDGRWWMFATVQDGGGSYSDALHLWSAPALRGPWTPHRRNPVLVDLATARPGGRVVRRGRKLIRPFQDCRKGYGTALGLAEIIHLDDDRFEQRVETILRPGPLWPGHRLHTLNRAGPLECIDGSASPRKLLPASGGRQRRPRIKRSPMTA